MRPVAGKGTIGNPHEALERMALVSYRNQAADEQWVALSDNRRGVATGLKGTNQFPYGRRLDKSRVQCQRVRLVRCPQALASTVRKTVRRG